LATGISYGQFNIVAGTVQEDGAFAGIVENRTPAESIADLYLLLEPAQSGSDTFCAELLTLIETQFGRPQYSLTGNLLQALRAAQEHLRAWNKTVPAEQQAGVGAACLAVSGNQAYLAQVGPGLVYLRHDGLLKRMQAHEPEAQTPLGYSIACAPEFTRFELNQGDSALLVSSRFGSMVDDRVADEILSMPPADALPAIYRLARQQTEFSALFLAVTGELQPPPNVTVDVSGTSDLPANSRALGALGNLTASLPPILEESFAPPAPLGHRFDVAEPTVGARRRWFMRRSEFERLSGHQLALPRPALYAFVAVAALLAAGWLGVPRLLQSGRQDRFSSLIQDAQTQEYAGNATSDVTTKRSLYQRAQADLVEARTLRPQDASLTTLDSRLTQALLSLNQARTLPSVTTVVDLASTPIATRSVTDIAALSRVYVLDSSTGSVYAFAPGGQIAQPTPVFGQGMQVDGISTGQAAHITVDRDTSAQQALVYILDANRRLFSLDSSGLLRSVSVTNANSWKTATAIAVAHGDLYILDSAGNQIWQFMGSDLGFVTPPAALTTKADLHDATQLAITDNPYISTSNGQLERVRGGRLEAADFKGLDHPMTSPQPPQIDSASEIQLIADPGNQRIVAMDKNGVYQYQFDGVELQGLRSVAVDPQNGTLFALSGQKILSSPLH
jgi:hypothetical protein